MDIQQKAMILLIKSALTGESFSLPEDFNLEFAVREAKRHQISAMFYYGALQCGISPKEPPMKQLFARTCQHISASERQMQEIDRIFAALDGAGIDYMPLKGTLLKTMYPKQEMRTMSDADILIRTEQYEQICPIMRALGFEEQVESDHEFIWNKHFVHIELHKRLIPSYNKDYYAYYGDGWRLAKLQDGTRFSMTDEDQFIYLFTHFAKHYRDGGIGIKHFADLWIYLIHKQNLDHQYIREELQKLQLNDFCENVSRTLRAWFADGEQDEVTELITNTILGSGVYGTREGRVLSDAVKASKTASNMKQTRRKKIFEMVFLPYKQMCKRYPVVAEAPLLLPVMWVVRWADVLLSGKNRIKQKRQDIKIMTVDKIDNHKKNLNLVGLDFNFKE